MKDIYLSVVIPSYNEMANLQKGVLDKVEHFLTKKQISFEVIVVDDGSNDGSIEFVQEFARENPHITLIKNQHTGKAGAVTEGMLAARGKYILFSDMDQATPIEEIDKLLVYFDQALPTGRQGYDIIIGSRNTTRKGSPLIRIFISRANIILRKLIVGVTDITDTQCGFKMFSHAATKQLFTRIKAIHNGFKHISGSNISSGFDVELLYLAEKMGYKIKEVPVRWLYVETRRVNPIKDSIEGLLDLIRIKLNDQRRVYSP